MKLSLAHYRNRFSMFRIYYALGAGLVKAHDIEVSRCPIHPVANSRSA